MITEEPMTRTFYVGDLCYVLNSDEWDTVCMHDFTPDVDGEYDCEGYLDPKAFSWEDAYAARPFYIFKTAYGDGCYEGNDGKSYSVDSGTIGAICVDCIVEKEKLAVALEKGLGHLHQFEDLTCGACGDEDGLIYFDQLEIATA